MGYDNYRDLPTNLYDDMPKDVYDKMPDTFSDIPTNVFEDIPRYWKLNKFYIFFYIFKYPITPSPYLLANLASPILS